MVENFSQCSCVTTMLDMRTSTTINGSYKEFGDYLQTMHIQHRGLLYFKAKGKRSFRPVQQPLYLLNFQEFQEILGSNKRYY